jgi:hypothetical protein
MYDLVCDVSRGAEISAGTVDEGIRMVQGGESDVATCSENLKYSIHNLFCYHFRCDQGL